MTLTRKQPKKLTTLCYKCGVDYDKLDGNFYTYKSNNRGYTYMCILCSRKVVNTYNRKIAKKKYDKEVRVREKERRRLAKLNLITDEQAKKYMKAADSISNKRKFREKYKWKDLKNLI